MYYKHNLKTDMTLHSDFDLDEEVFFMHENKVHKAKVISVNVFNNGLHQREEYGLAGMASKYNQCQIFKTTQDLLNSL